MFILRNHEKSALFFVSRVTLKFAMYSCPNQTKKHTVNEKTVFSKLNVRSDMKIHKKTFNFYLYLHYFFCQVFVPAKTIIFMKLNIVYKLFKLRTQRLKIHTQTWSSNHTRTKQSDPEIQFLRHKKRKELLASWLKIYFESVYQCLFHSTRIITDHRNRVIRSKGH